MNREAKAWADLFQHKENYSDDLIEPEFGLITSGSAGPSSSSHIFVTISFGVLRMLGDRRSVCERHLRLFANKFYGLVPKDAFGEDMKTKLMRLRLGPAGMTDDPVVKLAAHELLQQTTVRLSIVEMDHNSTFECRIDASNAVYFPDVKDK